MCPDRRHSKGGRCRSLWTDTAPLVTSGGAFDAVAGVAALAGAAVLTVAGIVHQSPPFVTAGTRAGISAARQRPDLFRGIEQRIELRNDPGVANLAPPSFPADDAAIVKTRQMLRDGRLSLPAGHDELGDGLGARPNERPKNREPSGIAQAPKETGEIGDAGKRGGLGGRAIHSLPRIYAGMKTVNGNRRRRAGPRTTSRRHATGPSCR